MHTLVYVPPVPIASILKWIYQPFWSRGTAASEINKFEFGLRGLAYYRHFQSVEEKKLIYQNVSNWIVMGITKSESWETYALHFSSSQIYHVVEWVSMRLRDVAKFAYSMRLLTFFTGKVCDIPTRISSAPFEAEGTRPTQRVLGLGGDI